MGIHEVLKLRNMRPKEAAKEIGISRQALYLVRRGTPAGRKVAKKLASWDNRISEAAVLLGKAV